ncbi:MAG TPA: DNA-processing protein DprA [Alphaproteobacteria bacterium]|nr:DNA-processing protein DprA [Alphaproteobacteria bacterium]
MRTPPLNDAERLAWLRLSRTENVGPITFKKLLQRYGSASRALDEIPGLAAMRSKRAFKIYAKDAAEKEINAVQKMGVYLLCLGDTEYPELLRQLEDAPPVITVRGRLDLLQKPGIAMVGARNASLPGRRMTEILAKDLASTYNIVSGLARGIDTAAHQAALAANGGTIAVLAGGIDIIYPAENDALYQQIAESGVIVAENPIGFPPTNRDFPRRNRIISGLSLATIVIEAALKSGSLITASYAAEQGREVMAVPGSPMDPRASGTNKLIKDGAQLIEKSEDVLQSIQSKNIIQRIKSTPDSLEEAANDIGHSALTIDANQLELLCKTILSDLSYAPCLIDDLYASTGASPAAVQTAILELELSGEVQRLPGGRVVRMAEEPDPIHRSAKSII